MTNPCGEFYTQYNMKLCLVRQVHAHIIHLCLTKKEKAVEGKSYHVPGGQTTDTPGGGSCQRTLSAELKWWSPKCKLITLFSPICYSCGCLNWTEKERPRVGKQTDGALTFLFQKTENNWKQSVVNPTKLPGKIREGTIHVC